MKKMEQNQSQNIQQEIDISTYILHGKMGNGKTLCGICMGMDWRKRIYSNMNIFQDGKLISKPISDFRYIKDIRFSFTPGVIIIDEAGINANSKDSFSAENRILQEVLFLARKKNCSVIWIAQRLRSIDINARDLADGIFKLKKIKRANSHPMFIVTREKRKGERVTQINSFEIDFISMLKLKNITYDQLEQSKIQKDLKQPPKKVFYEYIKNIFGAEKGEYSWSDLSDKQKKGCIDYYNKNK